VKMVVSEIGMVMGMGVVSDMGMGMGIGIHNQYKKLIATSIKFCQSFSFMMRLIIK